MDAIYLPIFLTSITYIEIWGALVKKLKDNCPEERQISAKRCHKFLDDNDTLLHRSKCISKMQIFITTTDWDKHVDDVN